MKNIIAKIDKEKANKQCNSEGCTNNVQPPVYRPKQSLWGYYNYCCACTHLKRKYGVTVPERQFILDKQKGKCKLCKTPIAFSGKKYRSYGDKDAVLDHCHDSDKIRGVLCGPCNLGLGFFRDDIERLKSAIEYLNNECMACM